MKEARVDSNFPNSIPNVGDLVRIRIREHENSIFEAKVIARGNECDRFWIQASHYQLILIAHSIAYKPVDLDLKKDGWKLGISGCVSDRNVKVEVIT